MFDIIGGLILEDDEIAVYEGDDSIVAGQKIEEKLCL